jgi:flagellar motor switch protein FliN
LSSECKTIIDLQLQSLEYNFQYIDNTIPNEMCLLIQFDIKTANTESMMNIMLPYPFLKPLLPLLSSNNYGNIKDAFIPKQINESMTDHDMSTIETGIDNLKVQVVVELGRTMKTFEEISKMAECSLIEVDSNRYEPVKIFANNVLIAKGEVIVFENDNFGIRVLEILGQNPEQQSPISLVDSNTLKGD